jgi:hypothetical protein
MRYDLARATGGIGGVSDALFTYLCRISVTNSFGLWTTKQRPCGRHDTIWLSPSPSTPRSILWSLPGKAKPAAACEESTDPELLITERDSFDALRTGMQSIPFDWS